MGNPIIHWELVVPDAEKAKTDSQAAERKFVLEVSPVH